MTTAAPQTKKADKADTPADLLTKIVVVNNAERLAVMQLPHVIPDRVKNPGQAIQLGGIVTLIPGANLIDVSAYETLCENKGFRDQFETEIPWSPAPEQNPERVGKPILRVMEELGNGGRVRAVGTLAALPSLKARAALIKEMLTSDQIHVWLQEEGDPETRKLLHKQLEAIGAGLTGGGPAVAGRA